VSKASDRLRWAVATLAVEPADRLLEIGCGHGVAVSLVCEKLDGGSITAIDRSATMIKAARKRNAAHIASGKASFQTVSLHEADFGDARFDKIFAIHVGLFLRRQPARELGIIKDCLAPGGGVYLFYQPLAEHEVGRTAETLSVVLDPHGFRVDRVLTRDLVPAVCVIAGCT
jgi:cyclopropane fatty-acyl-phospholipid synthase-like methyltransferase